MVQATEILLNYSNVKKNIQQVESEAGRDRGSVELVAVGKTFGECRIKPLLEAGQRCFGENRVQETEKKWPPMKKNFQEKSERECHLTRRQMERKAVVRKEVVRKAVERKLRKGVTREEVKWLYMLMRKIKIQGVTC